jgi:protein-L-isoaspartate(D-aspartate) O-methyltransferase
MNTALEAARTQMVNQQVRAWDVLDPAVLAALTAVPRERFVPPQYRALAFADTAIPLPCGQSLLTPQLEGRILQALALRAGEQVLEIGTGSGFFAACLARLGGPVTSIELHRELAEGARARLRETGAGPSITVVEADAFAWEPAGRFDAIAVTGSVAVDTPRFASWLAEGGRLFMVVGRGPAMDARLVRRTGADEFTTTSLFETVIPALERAPVTRQFVF